MLHLLLALQQMPRQNFPAVDHPGASDAVSRAFGRDCPAPRPATTTQLLHDQIRLADSVAHHDGAGGLLQLACQRTRLFLLNVPSQESYLQPMGDEWDEGVTRALVKASSFRVHDPEADDLLGAFAVEQYDPSTLGAITAAVRTAVAAGSTSPAVLRACAELELRAGHPDAVRSCAAAALAMGSDSTWHLIRLARLAFRAADTARGSRMFEQAASAAHDSTARGELDWQLQWFLAPTERDALVMLPDTARGAWLRDLMATRDIRDGRPVGARLAEHFARLDYVLANFRLHVNRETREALRTLPAAISDTLTVDAAVTADCEPGLIHATVFRDYRRWQTDIDDRGVVWMRFGKPTQVVDRNPVCGPGGGKEQGATINPRAAWRYDLGEQSLLLSFEVEKFSGSTEPTRLVSGVLGGYFCGIDAERCRLSSLSQASACCQGPPVRPEQVQQLHLADLESIGEATTRDDNSVRGKRNIGVTARLVRVWDPTTGSVLALTTYLLPVHDLAIERDDAQQRTTSVDLGLHVWDHAVGERRDTAIARRLILSDTSVRRPAVAGFIVGRASSGNLAWSITAAQDSTRWGRSFEVDVPSLPDGPIGLSDLILGTQQRDLVWKLHNLSIAIAPSNAVQRSDTVSLYYQVRSAAARADVRTTISVYRKTNGIVADTAALQVTYPEQALERGINEFVPTVELSRLAKGTYRIELRLTDATGVQLARRGALLDVQ